MSSEKNSSMEKSDLTHEISEEIPMSAQDLINGSVINRKSNEFIDFDCFLNGDLKIRISGIEKNLLRHTVIDKLIQNQNVWSCHFKYFLFQVIGILILFINLYILFINLLFLLRNMIEIHY